MRVQTFLLVLLSVASVANATRVHSPLIKTELAEAVSINGDEHNSGLLQLVLAQAGTGRQVTMYNICIIVGLVLINVVSSLISVWVVLRWSSNGEQRAGEAHSSSRSPVPLPSA